MADIIGLLGLIAFGYVRLSVYQIQLPVSHCVHPFDCIESPIHHYPHGIPVLQYIITILLLVLSLYFGKQLNFLLSTPPGYRTEGILRAELFHENNNHLVREEEADRNKRAARYSYIKQQLNECPYIEMWMNSHPSILRGSSFCTLLNDKDTRQNMLTLFPSPNFSIYMI